MSSISCGAVFSHEPIKSALSFIVGLVKSPHNANLNSGSKRLLGLLLLTLGAHLYYRNKFSFWSRRKVKTPPPVPIFGNFLETLLNPQQKLEIERRDKYGKIYGGYMGTSPYLMVADAQVLLQICIRHFDKFPNHTLIGLPNKYDRHFLFLLQGNEWRSMRALLSPTFSSGKIRKMFRLMDACVDDLIGKYNKGLAEATGDGIIIRPKSLFDSYTQESAMSTFYSVSLPENKNGPRSKDEVSRENLMRITSKVFRPNFMNIILSLVLPLKVLGFLGIHANRVGNLEEMSAVLSKIIEHRKRNPIQRVDYLQIVLDANSRDEQVEKEASQQTEDHHAMAMDESAEKVGFSKKKSLNREEVASQAMQFALVSSTLSYVLDSIVYILAHHDEEQSRLYEELKDIRAENGTFDYDRLANSEYLDCVVSECLRLMPPALFFDRLALEDFTIEGYDIVVPKGVKVNLAYFAIMRDPDYWPEPDRFDPERFSSQNKANIVPGSYCPFGIGPRACIAFRYALTQVKITVAKLVCEFRLEPAPGTKYPPEFKPCRFIANETEDLFVKLTKRSPETATISSNK